MLRLASMDASHLPRLQGVHEGILIAQRYIETIALKMTDKDVLQNPALKNLELYDDDKPEATYE